MKGTSAPVMTKLLGIRTTIAGCDYSIGADTAEGHGEKGDRTVICVTRRGAVGQPDVQAADFVLITCQPPTAPHSSPA